MTSLTPAASLRFGRFELQNHERRLLVDGVAAVLGARAFDLLQVLAERPGRLMGKRALMELVWPGLVVQDNNLAAQMSALRKVVGNDVIATIPGRGYRFVARIESATPAVPSNVAAAAPTAAARAPFTVSWGGLVALADDDARATAKAERLRAGPHVLVGGPDRVANALRDYVDAGAEWLMIAPVDSSDPDNARILGEEILPRLR